ncbi:hypothetical protein Tco_0358836 [Tanacetum coccineum]
MQEVLFEATSHAPVNVKERSKKNETLLIARAIGNLLGPKKLISLKMRTTSVDTGSPGLRNVGIRLKEQMKENKELSNFAKDEQLLGGGMKKKEKSIDDAKTTKKIEWNDPSTFMYYQVLEVMEVFKRLNGTEEMLEDFDRRCRKIIQIVIQATRWQAKTSSNAMIGLSDTRELHACIKEKTHSKWKFYTETSCKETQRLQRVGIAMLAIRVLYSHPTANDQDPMIRRNEGLRSKGAFKDLDPSTLAYKRSSTLTHRDI